MKANPGGQLAPSEVVGRDSTISQIWGILERQSVLLTAERRMGKTQMIRKMKADPPENILTFFRDVEGIRTRIEFVEAVYRDVQDFLSKWQKNCARANRILTKLEGFELGGLTFPQQAEPLWKDLLERTVVDLLENQSEQRVVFFWDEVPLMLYNVRHREGSEAAGELLDFLRQLRQMHARMSMVFTGSIGLHHVIGSLGESGYPNDPTNDMKLIDLPPLEHRHGVQLAFELLRGEGIVSSELERLRKSSANRLVVSPITSIIWSTRSDSIGAR